MELALALFIVGYMLVSVMVGVCGRYRRSGLLLTAVLAVFLTPPVMLLLLYLSPRRGPFAARPLR